MKFKYIALLSLTVSSTLLSCGRSIYVPKQYFSKYTYRDYQRNNVYNGGSAPTVGESRVLVIPIWFTDSSDYILDGKKENVRSDIEKAYLGTPEETGWHSVASYYALDSFGKSQITGVVTPWYEVGKPSTDFYSSDSDMMGLINDAVKWYKNLSGEQHLTSFDKDSDGFIDGLVLIYGAPDSSNLPGKDASNLWGYTSWVTYTNPNKINPNVKNFFWASYDFMYDQDTAFERAGTGSNRGDNQIAKIDAHCFIHEWGHCFGLPDYYDYNGSNSFAGGFSMQDYNVGAHDPFSRYALGWTSPYIPTQSCTIKLKPIEDSGESILLAPKFTDSCFDEYVMIEYYTPTGLNEMDTNDAYLGYYPSGLVEPGIRIWHIDARLLEISISGNITGYTTDPNSAPYVYPATSNSTYSESFMESDIHTLTLLRNNRFASYHSGANVVFDDLFYEGDSFSSKMFSSQFKNGRSFNNGKGFTWTVSVEEINEEYATIKLTK